MMSFPSFRQPLTLPSYVLVSDPDLLLSPEPDHLCFWCVPVLWCLGVQAAKFGGTVESGRANQPLAVYDGKIWIDLPAQCTIVFQHVV